MPDYPSGYRRLPERPTENVDSTMEAYMRDMERILVTLLNPNPTTSTVTVTDLTAGRLIATDSDKIMVSVLDFTDWIAGTANRISIADDGDGTVTLSGPQDIHTGASPTFAGITLTNAAVIGPNSVVFQPATDSTTFFQILDADGGTPILNIDSTNEGVGIKTDTPNNSFQVAGLINFDDGAVRNIFLGTDSFGGRPGGITQVENEGESNLGIGWRAGYYNDSSSGVGNAGKLNTYIGYFCGNGNAGGSSGFLNVGLGQQALKSLTTGSANMGIGSLSLASATTATNCVGVGNQSLFRNTEGLSNIGIGSLSLFSGTTGDDNIGIGLFVGRFNVTGGANILIGNKAGEGVSTNSYSFNTLVGHNSGRLTVTGSSNIFLGYKSGYNQTTNSNLLIIDNQDRGSAANEALYSLIYGVFNADPNSQSLTINADATVAKTLTVGESIIIGDNENIGSASDPDAMAIAADGTITLTKNLVLPNSTATVGIIYSGANTLLHTFGSSGNVFLGINAGNLTNSTAIDNIGIGENTLSSLDSGDDNTAVGDNALASLTTGNDNTAFGTLAGTLITTTSNSTAIGAHALENNTQANLTAVGFQALRKNTSGAANTAVGYQALEDNLTASGNTAVGNGVLQGSVGQWNTAVGNNAFGASAPGTIEGNTGIGYNIATGITTGDYNTLSGYSATQSLITGSRNTISGAWAGQDLTDGDDNVFLGHYAGKNQTTNDDLLIIDNQNRGSVAAEITDALIYGVFNATSASQTLRINASLSISGNIYPIGSSFLVFEKASGNGIKVDQNTPTFGWRDLEGFEIPDPTGGDRPTLSTYSGGSIKENAFSNGDVLRIRYHIPHDYVKGTDIFSHVHWSHNGTAISGNVVFGITSDYAKGHNQANFGTEKSISIPYATINISTTPRYRHRIEESAITNNGGSGTLIDRNLLEPDGIILVTFEVTTNPTITGGSPNNIFVHRADLHYQSTNIATKDKKPDFYV